MKELLKERGLWIAALPGFLAILAGFPFDKIEELPLRQGSFIEMYHMALDTQMILFLLPIAAVLPMGGVYVKESSSGFLRLYISRISQMQYIKRKTMQIYIGGFLPFFLAGIVALLLCFLAIYPMELQGEIPWESVWESMRYLLRIALVGGILAEVSGIFAVSFRNYYMAYGLPFVCYYMLVILKERYFTNMYAMYPAEWLKCEQDWGVDGMGIWIFLALFSLALMLLHGLLLYRRLKDI